MKERHLKKRLCAHDDLEQTQSQCPHIGSNTVRLSIFSHQFRLEWRSVRIDWRCINVTYRDVKFSALHRTNGDGLWSTHHTADAEITEFKHRLFVDEDILRFDITMKNTTDFEKMKSWGDLTTGKTDIVSGTDKATTYIVGESTEQAIKFRIGESTRGVHRLIESFHWCIH